MPVAWVQSGGEVPIPGSRPPTPSLFPVDTGTALYDVSLEARGLIYEDEGSKFRVGAGGALFVPSGTFSRGGSDNGVSLYLYGALEKGFGPLLFAGSLGPHFRPLRGIDGDDSRLDVGSEVRINAAAFFDLHPRFRVGGETGTSCRRAPACAGGSSDGLQHVHDDSGDEGPPVRIRRPSSKP